MILCVYIVQIVEPNGEGFTKKIIRKGENMKPEFDQYLVETYPKIFKNRYADMKETAMCWGFECDDGWFRIINELCGCVQSYLDLNAERNNISQVVADQVKEKYGGLRFYATGGDRLIEGMIWLAEYMSEYTCETCGKKGELHSLNGSPYGWQKTLCTACTEGTNYLPYPTDKEIEEFEQRISREGKVDNEK